MNPLATLSEQAGYEIARLEAAGVRLTAAEIVELNALGHNLETPEVRRALSRGRPVPLAGLWLWPLSLYAIEWLNDETPGMDESTQTKAVGYAMAHQYDDGDPLLLTGREAVEVVTKWAGKLRCTVAEFKEALRQVRDQDVRPQQPVDPNGQPMSLGDFSAFLSAACGGDVAFWERRCSFDYAQSVIATFVLLNRTDNHPCAADPKLLAERALGLAAHRIEERHRNQQEAPVHGS